MFQFEDKELKEIGASHTISEIYKQPEIWNKMNDILIKEEVKIKGFLEKLKTTFDQVRVIFTGAGTSAYVGNILLPELLRKNEQFQYESIPTTDLVSNPYLFFKQNTPTLLVSFARSGNSPESLAAVELGTQIVDNFYQLNITCNPEGKLAQQVENERILNIFTPIEANDQSMAMTSSFSTMLYTAYCVFYLELEQQQFTDHIIKQAMYSRENSVEIVKELVQKNIERIVFIGSGSLGKLGEEAALKVLELTSGEVISLFDSSLGFRHGPKSFINDQTVIVCYLSNNAYARKYDVDIVNEVAQDSAEPTIFVLGENINEQVRNNATEVFELPNCANEEDFRLIFSNILISQLMAVFLSIKLGYKPDNPSPDGRINRVVKGVQIYPYK